MKTLLIIMSTILVYEFINFLLILFVDKEDVIYMTCSFIPSILFIGLQKVYSKIMVAYYNKKYRICTLYLKGAPVITRFVEHKDLDKYNVVVRGEKTDLENYLEIADDRKFRSYEGVKEIKSRMLKEDEIEEIKR